MRRWRNWAGNVRCSPSGWERPRSVEEVAAAVRRSARRGERIKAVGSGHSFSAIAAPAGRGLRLDRMRRLVEVDHERRTVSAEAGIRLKELVDALAEHRLALPVLGTAAEQTLGGAIATATHGTGIRFGVLPTLVEELELVDGAGDLATCSPGARPELFAAARTSLGALGIVTRARLRLREVFALRALALPATLDGTLAELDRLVAEHRHFKLWWWPHTDEVRLWLYDEVEAPEAIARRPRPLDRERMTAGAGGFALWASSRLPPSAIPPLKRALVPLFNRRYERVERADRIFNYPVPMRHLELEYAVPAGEAAAALEDVRSLVEKSGIVVDFLVEVRFTAADDIWLSPAHGRDTCFLGAFMYRADGWERYFRAVEERLIDRGGRPHWGKLHFRSGDDLRAAYPHWDDFAAVRRRCDPEGLFLNAELERLFASGPTSG